MIWVRRYILTSVHDIQPDVPPENVITMFEEARNYGVFSLTGRLIRVVLSEAENHSLSEKVQKERKNFLLLLLILSGFILII